jgi:hypothetical protein
MKVLSKKKLEEFLVKQISRRFDERKIDSRLFETLNGLASRLH